MKIRNLLLVIIALQSALVLGQWLGGPVISPASAQTRIIDPGAQRQQMIEQQKQTNEKLDVLIDLLEGGDLQVRAKSADAR